MAIKKPLFWSKKFGSVIDYLKTKKFVNIVSETRTGSSALYSSIAGKQDIDLNETFTETNTDQMLDFLEANRRTGRVMKNHAYRIINMTEAQQKRLFDLPAFHVALSRLNLFEQSASLALAELLDRYDEPHGLRVTMDVSFYRGMFYQCLTDKINLAQLDHFYDMIIYYEDIEFPVSQSKKKFLKKHINIVNINEIKKEYIRLLDVQNRYRLLNADKYTK